MFRTVIEKLYKEVDQSKYKLITPQDLTNQDQAEILTNCINHVLFAK